MKEPMSSFKIHLAEVPNPRHMPIAKTYRPGLIVAVVQPRVEIPHLIRNIKSALEYNEWLLWAEGLQDPEVDPRLVWSNPEKHLPGHYWSLEAIPEHIPDALK